MKLSVHLPLAGPDHFTERKKELLQNLQPRFYGPDPPPNPAFVRESSSAYGKISDAALRFFLVVAHDWFRCPMSDMYKFAGITSDEGLEYIDELVRSGLVKIHRAKTFHRGGQFKFILPTHSGLERLENARAKVIKVRGDAPHADGDGTHIWYQNRIERYLNNNGWHAQIEMTLYTKRVDVGAEMENGRHLVAYEVVNENLEKELVNLEKDLASEEGWHKVIFCVGNKQIQKQLDLIIQQRFGVAILEKVGYELLPKFNDAPKKKA